MKKFFLSRCIHLSILPTLMAPFGLIQAAETSLEEVFVSGTRYQQDKFSLPGSYSLVDQKALEISHHQHIQEVLARLPGVDFHRNNGQEYLPALRSPVLTGAGACGSFLMAEDGIPLRPAGFCNVNELFEAHSEAATQIEVIRGPANAFYGSNALHGVVNVIAPAAFDQAPRLGLELGPDDYQRVQVSAGNENFAGAFTGSHDGGYRDQSGVDQQKVSLRYRRQLDDLVLESGLTSTNLNQETAGFIEGYEAYKDKDLAKSNSNPEAYRDAKATRLWVRLQDSTTDPAWLITPYARYSEMAFLQHFLPGTPLEENGQTSAGLQSAAFFYGDNYRVVTGLDMEWTDGWLKQSQASVTPGSAFLQETIPIGQHYDYSVIAKQIAPFVQGDLSLSSSLSLSAGLRYESMHYDYDNHMLAGRTRDDGSVCGFGGCRYSRPESGQDSFNNWSPNIGVLYSYSDKQQLFANIAQGYRAPQAVELYRLQRKQTVADLDSEKLSSVEFGYRGRGDNLTSEVVVYFMEKDNVIYRDSSFFNVSDGKTEHYGIEADIQYRLSDTWDLRTVATAARHKYTDAGTLTTVDIKGNNVDTAPKLFGSVFLGWEPNAQSRIELEWLHMGKYYTDPENEHSYAGHDLVNLRGQTTLSRHVRLSAKVLNLFDTDYADRADYTGFSGDRYLPGARRGLFVAAEYQW